MAEKLKPIDPTKLLQAGIAETPPDEIKAGAD